MALTTSADTKIRPVLDDNTVVKIIEKLYGLHVKTIKELNSYDDKNYHVICDEIIDNKYLKDIAGDGYVLKIINSLDSKNHKFIEGQNEMMFYLKQHQVNCPLPIQNSNGSYYSLEQFHDETFHIVRLLLYCPGEILYNVKISSELLYNVGRFTAQLNNTLRDFSHIAYYENPHLWSLLSVPKLRDYIYVVNGNDDKLLIQQVIKHFEDIILGNIDKFEKGMIHGDLNEQNILVNNQHNDVIGIIDFGDTQYTCLIFDLIIALCYMIIQAHDITMGKYVLAGFQSIKKLTNAEKCILKTGVCGRLCQSLVWGTYSHLNEPQNNYLLVTQKYGWKILRELWPMTDDDINNIWGL